jgi:hypothetical protein
VVTSEVVTQGSHEGIPNLRQPPPLHPDDDGAIVFRHLQNWTKILVRQHNEFSPSLPLTLVPFSGEELMT